MQAQRSALAGERSQQHADEADQAADAERDRERLVAAAEFANPRAEGQHREDREEGDHHKPSQREQPRGADGSRCGKMEMVGDEQAYRDVRPIEQAVDRRDHDVEGDDGPGRDEIGGKQHAIE